MNATGLLRHQFFGEYSAGIVLQFASSDCASGALELLPAFQQSKDKPECLIACLASPELDKFKDKLKSWRLEIEPCGFSHCKHQCRHEDIDSVAHSIDFGPNFTIDLPAVPASQTKFAFATSTSEPHAKLNPLA